MSRCEWNAFLRRPSQDPARPTDCDQEARWSVGSGKNNFHLCEGCAKLPDFRRFTKRVRLKREAPTQDVRERKTMRTAEEIGAGCSDGHASYDPQCPACWQSYCASPWVDVKDEWTEQIRDAFPTRSGSYDEYGLAMRMVGQRRSKGALVALVNWLLVRCRDAEQKPPQ